MSSNSIHNQIESFFVEHEHIRMFLLILTGILTGYILTPIPKKLHELFHNNVFKFFLLVFIGYITFSPINDQKFLYIIVSSFILLAVFEWLRTYN